MSALINPRRNEEAAALGPWFHNLHLPDGSQTAPEHFLGDFPSFKWSSVSRAVPQDMRGWTALDIGCNAGFYSFEMARRGARVVGLDVDARYLRQANWAAQRLGLSDSVEFRQGQVHDLITWDSQFDFVWFTGVFYHLRYPALALDLVRRATRKLLMFQSLTMPGGEPAVPPPADMRLDDRDLMLADAWPKLAFIENSLETDATNWWAPNAACVEALLRTAGFRVLSRPEHEFWMCEPVATPPNPELDRLRSLATRAP